MHRMQKGQALSDSPKNIVRPGDKARRLGSLYRARVTSDQIPPPDISYKMNGRILAYKTVVNTMDVEIIVSLTCKAST